MSTFRVYTPTAGTSDKEAQDALSTLKNFTCFMNEETGESMIVIELHEDNIEIKCPFDVAPIQTLGEEERNQYMNVVCNTALSVYYKTRQVMSPNRDKYAELESKCVELESKCAELRTCIASQGRVILEGEQK